MLVSQFQIWSFYFYPGFQSTEYLVFGDDVSFYLARSANLPTGLYILLALISFFFLN